MLGETVNLAAKLEKHTKVEAASGIVSDTTFALAAAQGFTPRLAWRRCEARAVEGVYAAEIAALEERLGDPGLHLREPEKAASLFREIEVRRAGLAGLEERWLELEAMREAGEI